MSKLGYRHLACAVQAGLMVGTLGLFMPAAWAAPGVNQLPEGGLSPTAAITAAGANMTVDGQAPNNVIAWDSFSIGRDAAVNFTGSNNYLNYVTGKNLSEIFGTMSGGNNVYLVNPNGIIFGETAKINVGSLYASTRNLTNDEIAQFYNTGSLNPVTPTSGDVVNQSRTSLGNMNITFEGDTVTFVNSSYDAGENKVTLGSGENYTIYANSMDVGYSKVTSTKPAADATITNLSNTAPTTIYCELIGPGEGSLTELSADGKYMLSGNISGQLVPSSTYFFNTGFLLDGAGYTATLSGNSLLSKKMVGATIRNLTLTGNVTSDSNVGALTETAENTTIANVFNKANVTGTFSTNFGAGGLVGVMTGGTLKNSGNEGSITVTSTASSSYAGGLAGAIIGVKVDNVYNKGTVSVSGSSSVLPAAGLFGVVNDTAGTASTITNSYNEGDITGNLAGGLLGLVTIPDDITLKNVFNSGAVTATNATGGYAGGLVANVSSGKLTVENAYNTGAVNGTSAKDIGNDVGSVGASPTLTLKQVYNTGKVNGSDAFTYYDASGTKSTVSSASEIASSGAFADTSTWRTYGTNAPLLKSFLSPLYFPSSSGSYENGQAVYRFYVYGNPSHLSGYTLSGNMAEGNEATLVADQLGYDLFFEPPTATPSTPETHDYLGDYRNIGKATHMDDDTDDENVLDDAANRSALDVSNAVQHATITEGQVKEMMGEGGTISSKAGDEVNTEHYEFGDFDDGNAAGKVEH